MLEIEIIYIKYNFLNMSKELLPNAYIKSVTYKLIVSNFI